VVGGGAGVGTGAVLSNEAGAGISFVTAGILSNEKEDGVGTDAEQGWEEEGYLSGALTGGGGVL